MVPSSNCASISLVPTKAVFWLRATPQRTCEAISQERGVGQALASEVVSAACRRSGLKRRKAMISGRTCADGPPAPVAQVGFEFEMDETIAQRPRHREMHAALRCRIAGGDDDPPIGEHVFAQFAVENELVAASLGHLRRRGQLVQKENALAVVGRNLGGTHSVWSAAMRAGRADRPDRVARRARRESRSRDRAPPGRRSATCPRRTRPRCAGAHVRRSAHEAPRRASMVSWGFLGELR